MEKEKIKSFTGTVKLGYISDMATEWWTDEDWKRHEEYVEELKAKGEYGKEVEVTISFVHNPLFDDPIFRDRPPITGDVSGKVIATKIGECKLVWLDFSDIQKDGKGK